MNVSLQNIDQASALLTVKIEKADYQEKAEKSLRKLRQSVQMPGFRPGMVPMGLVRKLYGKSVVAEEVNKLMSEATYNYIHDNKVKMLGEPLPDEERQPAIDFETMDEFEFVLDIALAPDLGIAVSADDHLPYHRIEVTPEAVEERIGALAQQYGNYQELTELSGSAYVTGELTELDAEGNAKEGGISIERASMMPRFMKDDDQKKRFEGAHLDEVVTFNPYTAWNGNEAELASLLQIDKEEAKDMHSDFAYRIKEMNGFVPAQVGQDLFDKVYGQGTVDSEETFRQKVAEDISQEYEKQSDLQLHKDCRNLLMQKAGRPPLADNLLKRIMLQRGEDMTPEKVEENYEISVEALIWHLVKEELVVAYAIKVDDEDVENEARQLVRQHYAQYSSYSMPEAVVEKQAQEILKKEDDVEALVDRVIENKMFDQLKKVVTLDVETVSLEKFLELTQPPMIEVPKSVDEPQETPAEETEETSADAE